MSKIVCDINEHYQKQRQERYKAAMKRQAEYVPLAHRRFPPNPKYGINSAQPYKKQAMVMYKQPSNIIKYQQTHSGGEVKGVDIISTSGNATQTPFLFNATPQFTALNLLTAGSSSWQRVGRKVSMKSIQLRGAWTPANASTTGQYARLMIVYDKQPNGALPAITDLLRDQVNSATDSNTESATSGLNLNNKDRFEIIRDATYILPAISTGAVANDIPTFTTQFESVDLYSKLMRREVHFKADSTPGVIGDIATGSLFLCTFGNLTAGTEGYSLLASIRLRYTDL